MALDPGILAQIANPPRQPDALDRYGKLLALRGEMQGQQLQGVQLQGAQIDNQQKQQLFSDQQKISQLMASPDVHGDLSLALPRFGAAGISGQSFLAYTKAHAENGKTAAETSKAIADAAEANTKAADAQNTLLGNSLQHVKDEGYTPDSFGAAATQLESANPALKPKIDQYRAQVATAPDTKAAIQQIVDTALASSGVGEKVNATRAEKAKNEATTAGEQAKLPGEQANSDIAVNKAALIKNAKPEDYMALVDQIAPPSVKENAALNQRTKAQVQFYLNKGDVEGAKAILTGAATEVRSLEEKIDPRVQANKVALTIQNVQARTDANQAASGLTDDDYKRAGQQYNLTGVMPPLGRDSVARGKIMHAAMEDARDNGMSPRDVALGQAAYLGDKNSLVKFQAQRDQIVSFESTATKNLDLFLNSASKIVDSGVPWLNTPLRQLSDKLIGSQNMAAVNAARQVANNEIAKVTSGGGLSGVLSDSARHEVESYNPQNATLAQTFAVAKVLKQDMANRHGSMDATLGEIKGRIAGGSSGAQQPAPMKVDGTYNPKTGKIE